MPCSGQAQGSQRYTVDSFVALCHAHSKSLFVQIMQIMYCLVSTQFQKCQLDDLLDFDGCHTCRPGDVDYEYAMNMHTVARGIMPNFSGTFDFTLHGVATKPKKRDSESGEEDLNDAALQMQVKVPRDMVSLGSTTTAPQQTGTDLCVDLFACLSWPQQ